MRQCMMTFEYHDKHAEMHEMPDDAIDSIMVSIMGITIWEALWNL